MQVLELESFDQIYKVMKRITDLIMIIKMQIVNNNRLVKREMSNIRALKHV